MVQLGPPQQGKTTSSPTVVVGNVSVSPALPLIYIGGAIQNARLKTEPHLSALFSPAPVVAKRWGYFYASGKTIRLKRLRLSQAYHTA